MKVCLARALSERCARALPARCVRALSATLVLLGPGVAGASGFHVDEQDARATGRAGAVIAQGGNASAVYYSPAAIAELRGVQVQVGASLVRPTAEFAPAGGGAITRVDADSFVLPQLFASWRASELVALGIGVYSPFGLALDWPASSPGRASVRQAELRTLFISPTWALNLSRWVPGLALALGADLVPSSVRLTRDILFGADVASAALSGSAFGLGGRAGISYRPSALPALALGLSYHSPVQLQFRGDADFDAPSAYRSSLPPDGAVRTSVTLPQMLSLGIAVTPVRAWQIEIDGNWRGWSSYDRLDLELPGDQLQSSRKDWRNSVTVRLGSEYAFDERWSARLGGIWDQTPIPTSTLDFQLPDLNRVVVTAGFGAQISPALRADLGGLYVLPGKRSTSVANPLEPPVKGSFEIDALVVGLSLGIQLDLAEAPPLDPSNSYGAASIPQSTPIPQ
jgi:long-chain fatty acid transport protein